MVQASSPYDAPKVAVTEPAGPTQPVKLFSVSGRIGRVRYVAYGIGLYFLVAVVGGILAAVLGQAGVVILVLLWAVLGVIGFMLTIQRSHDFDASGWLSILMLVPLVNLIFWFIPGTDGPNRYGPPTPPNGVGAIVVVCVVPIGVVLLGIVAAVAVPAYQDYSHRARVSEAILAASAWRTAVTEHHAQTGKLPASLADLRRDAVPSESGGKYSTVSLGAQGVLTVTLSEATASIAHKTIVFNPRVADGALQWDCSGGTLEPRHRPASCRARPGQ